MMEYISSIWAFLSSVPAPVYLVVGAIFIKAWSWVRNRKGTPKVDHRANLYTIIDGLLNEASNWNRDSNGIAHLIASVRITIPSNDKEPVLVSANSRDVSQILYPRHLRWISKKARRLGVMIIENKAQAEAANVTLNLQPQLPPVV